MARRPACASGTSCLSTARLSKSGGAAAGRRLLATPPAEPVVLSAEGFASDYPMTFDFGVELPNGRRNYHERDSASPTYVFALYTLPPGDHILFVCARGAWGRCGIGAWA